MNTKNHANEERDAFPAGDLPVNISRRHFLLATAGTAAGALVLGFGLPLGKARAMGTAGDALAPGTNVPAFLEIRPDNSVRLQSPFNEGGQGIFTAMAQIVGEELDADPSGFLVQNAPTGKPYQVMGHGGRFTGGSMSVRSSYSTMRRLGALARRMLLEAGARELGVPVGELTTEPGHVVHAASGKRLSYGALAPKALDLAVPDPDSVQLKKPSQFRWIGKPVKRVDAYDKSTGRVHYSIDTKVEGMLQAAVQHAPRLGMTVGTIHNEAQLKAMKGVHSVHRLDGAVAVVAERWWVAHKAALAAKVSWKEAAPDPSARHMPADFSTRAYRQYLAGITDDGQTAESEGDLTAAMKGAHSTVEATYSSQYLHHAQLEPPSTLAHFHDDGTLEIWMPNQAPDLFVADIASKTKIDPSKIVLHTPMLGGFFGRHFTYGPAGMPYLQAIALAKATQRPVKLIWSREQEFLRDPMRPMAVVRFRGGLDADGMPVALEAVTATEGPSEGISNKRPAKVDSSAVEGLSGKAYAIPNRRIAQNYKKTPAMLAYWRSVGHSMNDFFYETFLDELADKGGKDPYELRLHLLKGNARLTNLLKAVADLSGGWKRGPFTAADGSRRARGVAMASPFGSQAAVIAEVSIENGKVRVHDLWQAIDPGSIVNPAIIDAQVASASALGLSQVLLEETIYEHGEPVARNFDKYKILTHDRMPRVHVRIVESGAKMGGIGEPPLPATPPAVVNAVSHLIGKRIRSMPLSQVDLRA